MRYINTRYVQTVLGFPFAPPSFYHTQVRPSSSTLAGSLILLLPLGRFAMSNITFYNVDDNDSRVRYSAGWHSVQNDNAYNGTLHYTTEAGATVTLVFTGHPLFSLRIIHH